MPITGRISGIQRAPRVRFTGPFGADCRPPEIATLVPVASSKRPRPGRVLLGRFTSSPVVGLPRGLAVVGSKRWIAGRVSRQRILPSPAVTTGTAWLAIFPAEVVGVPVKGQALTICYTAWNTSTNQGQTGDEANHTIKLVQDGTEASPTNSPEEVNPINAPGTYKLDLDGADTDFGCIVVCGISMTANVVIVPLVIATTASDEPTGIDNFPFFMALSSDHYSPALNKTVTATRNIDGAGFLPCANPVNEDGGGWYRINLAISDLSFTSTVAFQFTAPGCDTTAFTKLVDAGN